MCVVCRLQVVIVCLRAAPEALHGLVAAENIILKETGRLELRDAPAPVFIFVSSPPVQPEDPVCLSACASRS